MGSLFDSRDVGIVWWIPNRLLRGFPLGERAKEARQRQ